MQFFHYVFKLVFQLFYIGLAELLLQMSFLSLWGSIFRPSEATRCVGISLASITIPSRRIITLSAKNILFEFFTDF